MELKILKSKIVQVDVPDDGGYAAADDEIEKT